MCMCVSAPPGAPLGIPGSVLSWAAAFGTVGLSFPANAWMLCAQTRTVSLVSWRLAEKQFCHYLHFIERETKLGERAGLDHLAGVGGGQEALTHPFYRHELILGFYRLLKMGCR